MGVFSYPAPEPMTEAEHIDALIVMQRYYNWKTIKLVATVVVASCLVPFLPEYRWAVGVMIGIYWLLGCFELISGWHRVLLLHDFGSPRFVGRIRTREGD
jgi:FtsH-binding integral membrane protein